MNSLDSARAETRFRCKVGGEMKPLSEFSKNQQKNLSLLMQRGRSFDVNNCGMTCKEHTSGSRTEMRCELCRLTKPLQEFSKNSRRNGEHQCRRCTAWVEIQEPGVTPGPLETGHLSPEEELQQQTRQRFLTSEVFFPDEHALLPQAPITSMSALDLNEDEFANASEVMSSMLSQGGAINAPTDATAVSALPPHLKNKVSRTPTSTAASVAGSSRASTCGGESLPPHLRAKARVLATSTPGLNSSTVSSTGSISLPTTLLDTDSDANSLTNHSFNVWGPDGLQQHQHHTQYTVESDTVSTIAADEETAENDPNVIGDWSRVPKVTKHAPSARRKGGWVKASENRMSAAAIRDSLGNVPTCARKDVYVQSATHPIGFYSDDSD